MALGEVEPEEAVPIPMGGEGDEKEVKVVDSFVYLGSEVQAGGGCSKEVKSRLTKASKKFGALRNVLVDRRLSTNTRKRIYMTCVLETLLYGCEAWPLKVADEKSLESFNMRCIRSMLKLTSVEQWQRSLTNQSLRDSIGLEKSVGDMIRFRRMQWLGHVCRMDDSRLPKRMLFSHLPTKRPVGGTRLRWKDKILKDCSRFDIPPEDLLIYTADRPSWRSFLHEATREEIESRRSLISMGPTRAGQRISVRIPDLSGLHAWYKGKILKDSGDMFYVVWDNGDKSEWIETSGIDIGDIKILQSLPRASRTLTRRCTTGPRARGAGASGGDNAPFASAGDEGGGANATTAAGTAAGGVGEAGGSVRRSSRIANRLARAGHTP